MPTPVTRRRFAPPSANGRPRVAVVGAGIVGLAHAWAAARRGWDVLLFDRDRRAAGASIRNFGMVWPIGQRPGRDYQTALRSCLLWRDLLQATGLWGCPCGSVHLAYRQDEWEVLAEFAASAPREGLQCELITPEAARALSPAASLDGLLGALWSPNEMCVDPRQVIRETPAWLERHYGVQLYFNVAIDRVAQGQVFSPSGNHWNVDRVIIAAGADLNTLYPDLYAAAGFKRCKLQMLRTPPQPHGWKLGAMLAGGLTLRHYEAFAYCRSLAALKARIASETPALDRYGIHVMAAQNGLGEIVLGDSHEYDDDITPFDKAEIDQLMLRELRRIIDLPDWTIAERWHGVYLKKPGCVEYTAEPEPDVHISVASGGCGMTMSFGLADDHWTEWEGPFEAAAAVRPAVMGAVPSGAL